MRSRWPSSSRKVRNSLGIRSYTPRRRRVFDVVWFMGWYVLSTDVLDITSEHRSCRCTLRPPLLQLERRPYQTTKSGADRCTTYVTVVFHPILLITAYSSRSHRSKCPPVRHSSFSRLFSHSYSPPADRRAARHTNPLEGRVPAGFSPLHDPRSSSNARRQPTAAASSLRHNHSVPARTTDARASPTRAEYQPSPRSRVVNVFHRRSRA